MSLLCLQDPSHFQLHSQNQIQLLTGPTAQHDPAQASSSYVMLPTLHTTHKDLISVPQTSKGLSQIQAITHAVSSV